ncbi:hypothetical protein P4G95_09170 [Burkholderia vietnamiensis]|uniref:hypothetical protein n=1 Tax=Burkholderia vietnamiensis TaxID=60552 RepID=UPI000B294F36|nr:hypothetical protein [Burkholderia vietnamiensis]MCA8247948.1 hypothetical protein [Burkholderia multivorans]WHU91049.1 hypothetical protein P4G95_09170 [Burkholderia vietnamiensis]
MRYYDIAIFPQSTEGLSTLGFSTSTTLNVPASSGALGSNKYGFTAGSSLPIRHWTSHPNGAFDPGALNVEFDLPVAAYGTPDGLVSILIEGVPLGDLLQAHQFAGMYLVMKGGMQAGLPLANPKQAGPLVAGRIFQSFGNWEGTEMTLDLVLNPAEYTLDQPGNIVLNWKAGMTLSAALQQTLSVAYPALPISINISDLLVNSSDVTHVSSTLEELAQFILQYTEGHYLGADYAGVQIAIRSGQIVVYDNTYKPNTVQLAFTDFVGQPTWIAPNEMQVKLVMRADIQLNTELLMPQGMQNTPGIVLTSSASMPSNAKYKSAFQGKFFVKSLRHIGNFRALDGASWVTVANCVVPSNG